MREADERAIEREFEQAVLDAAVAEAQVEVPDKLVHARAHELLDETLTALARQGISKEAYLRIAGKDEETLAHEAEPEAAAALQREAVLAAIVEAEAIEPSDEEVLRGARARGRARRARPRRSCSSGCATAGGSSRLREDVATRQAIELLVREAKPISVEQAKAREKLWTPGKEEAGQGRASCGRPGS